MPFPLIPLAIMAGGALAGALSNRGQKQTTQQKQNESFDNWQTPQYDSESNFLKNTLINRYLDMIQGDDGEFWEAYKKKGVNEINASEDSTNNIIRQIMSQRGLSLSPGGASGFANAAMNSQMQKGNMLSQVPLLQDQRRRGVLGEASGFFNSLPYSIHRSGTGSSESSGTVSTPGNMLGGGITGLISSLANLYGAGAFGGGSAPSSGTPSFGPVAIPQVPKLSTGSGFGWRS
jgi:hypothetical protein